MAEPDFDKMTPEEIAEYQRQNCIFCKIVKGDIPSRKVYEDEKMFAILDIYPAQKGHVLLMPKDHYPFLPVIPQDVARQLFRTIRGISKAAKAAIVTNKSTVFVANGGVAGQQAPHFICHIIPRENNDSLDNFNIPMKDINPADTDRMAVLIKQRLSSMNKGSSKQVVAQEADRKEIAEFILDNPNIKDLIVSNPTKFKEELEKNPDLKKAFAGIDLSKLSEMLKQVK